MSNAPKTLAPCDHDECGLTECRLVGGSDQRLVIESIDLDDMDDDEPDDTCPECAGSGTDRYNDHILECPKCDGEGTL